MYYDELDDEEYEDDVLEDEYEDDFDDEIERHDRRLHPGGQCFSPDCYCINSTLTVKGILSVADDLSSNCLLYTSPSPRDATLSRMPSSA